jgi:hypothetical protein
MKFDCTCISLNVCDNGCFIIDYCYYDQCWYNLFIYYIISKSVYTSCLFL